MISFSCECGKRFQVKDELAGKRAKCSCGKMLVIPAGAAPQIGAPSAEATSEPPRSPVETRPRARTKSVRPVLVVGSAVLAIIAGTIGIWSFTGAKWLAVNAPARGIQGYFDATTIGVPKNAPCVWAIEPDGYVTVYQFIDEGNLLLMDGTCRLGNPIDGERYELTLEGDLPIKGNGEMKIMSHASNDAPDGFTVTVNESTTEFRGVNAKKLVAILKEDTKYFDFRKTHKGREWNVADRPNAITP